MLKYILPFRRIHLEGKVAYSENKNPCNVRIALLVNAYVMPCNTAGSTTCAKFSLLESAAARPLPPINGRAWRRPPPACPRSHSRPGSRGVGTSHSSIATKTSTQIIKSFHVFLELKNSNLSQHGKLRKIFYIPICLSKITFLNSILDPGVHPEEKVLLSGRCRLEFRPC